MFDAVHKNTKQWFHSYEVLKLYDHPEKEEWLCCPFCQKTVIYYREFFRTVNEEEQFVHAHFKTKNLELGECIYGESDEHRISKTLLSTLLGNNKINLIIDKLSIKYSNLNANSPHLPYRWEQTRENRRSDVLVEFTEWHPLLGKGIDFEIQKKRQTSEEIEIRENDWIKQGYSLAWIPLERFNEDSLSGNEIEINVIWLMRIFQIKNNELMEIILNFQKKYEDKLSIIDSKNETKLNLMINETSKTLDKMIEGRLKWVEYWIKYPISIRICENCKSFKEDRRFKNHYVCWEGIPVGVRKPPKKGILPNNKCEKWQPKPSLEAQ